MPETCAVPCLASCGTFQTAAPVILPDPPTAALILTLRVICSVSLPCIVLHRLASSCIGSVSGSVSSSLRVFVPCALLQVWVSGVAEAVDKVNMILTQLRATFIECVPFSINLKDVLLEMKYNLYEFAKTTLGSGKPDFKLVTDFSLFMKGQSPITDVMLVDKDGKSFGIDSLAKNMTGALQFVFNLFFNSESRLVSVRRVVASPGLLASLPPCLLAPLPPCLLAPLPPCLPCRCY
jgi:hypothetical protein